MKTCRDDSLRLALKQIVQESRSYIGSHRNRVLEGEGLLEMSKEALTGVLCDTEVRMAEGEGLEEERDCAFGSVACLEFFFVIVAVVFCLFV